MNSVVIFGISAVGAIVGLVTILRQAGLPSKFAPLVDVVLGLGAGFAALYSGSLPYQGGTFASQFVQAIVVGIGAGFAAAQAYDIPSNVKNAFTSDKPVGA